MVAPRCRRGQRLQAALRDLVAQEVGRGEPQEVAQDSRRALPRHGRGPRGRVHRLASLRGAFADGPGQADGVPRDHAGGDRASRRRLARARPTPGGRARGASHPRPTLRLRGVARAVAKGDAEALGGPGPERRHPDGRRARAGAHALPRRHLVGNRRDLHQRGRPERFRCLAGQPGRDGGRHRQGLRRAGPTSAPAARCACWARRRRPRSRAP